MQHGEIASASTERAVAWTPDTQFNGQLGFWVSDEACPARADINPALSLPSSSGP